jgi:hypothetical protein
MAPSFTPKATKTYVRQPAGTELSGAQGLLTNQQFAAFQSGYLGAPRRFATHLAILYVDDVSSTAKSWIDYRRLSAGVAANSTVPIGWTSKCRMAGDSQLGKQIWQTESLLWKDSPQKTDHQPDEQKQNAIPQRIRWPIGFGFESPCKFAITMTIRSRPDFNIRPPGPKRISFELRELFTTARAISRPRLLEVHGDKLFVYV